MMTHYLEKELTNNDYPGRGIIIGKTPDATKAVLAYFITGRSENSQNRILVTQGEGIRTQAYDPAKLTDPSLIIYTPVRVLGDTTIVTNGDHTDTIYQGLEQQMTLEQSLQQRYFEPDPPNYTPRISGIVKRQADDFGYTLAIIKSCTGHVLGCNRYYYSYEKPMAGEGHLIHTYQCNDHPLPSFIGEPRLVEILDNQAVFAKVIWEHLSQEYKVALFVRYIDIASGNYETVIINRHEEAL